jgi:hypothetical protein
MTEPAGREGAKLLMLDIARLLPAWGDAVGRPPAMPMLD